MDNLSPENDNSPTTEIRAGNLAVLIAKTEEDIESALRLRYKYFSEGGKGDDDGIDRDAYDAVCDHLLVKDYDRPSGQQVVGTYRLLRREAMEHIGKFYSENEYDISALKNYPGEILELGRSCVDEEYRGRAVMQLLWRGIGSYVFRHGIDIMFGCASFNGTDPQEHAAALSYLYHYHLAPPELRPVALPDHYVDMNLMAKDELDKKAAFSAVPPLIKGYLRVGGYIGDGAFADHALDMLDVSIIVKTDKVTEKYVHRYGTDGRNE